jgi:hypothetical protein
VCAAVGQAVHTGPGGPPCVTHRADASYRARGRRTAVRHPVRSRVPRRGAGRRPRRPRRVLEHTPRVTGSRRVPSMLALELDARRLARLARYARRQHRVLSWLAVVAYHLDVHRPAGAGKADARRNALSVAMLHAVSADWASGRRSRPGRRLSAALLGLSERTVERHWQLLECARLLRGSDVGGRLLPTAARQAILTDLDERIRTANRKEMALSWPWWVREITDEQLAPYVDQVRVLLDELVARLAPVDNVHPGQMSLIESVAPSLGGKLFSSVPVVRTKFSTPVTVVVDNVRPAPGRPKGRREQPSSASRSSSTNRGATIRPQSPLWAVDLARMVVTDGRLQPMRGAQVGRIARVLSAAVGPSWTVDDVVAEARIRLGEARQVMVATADWAPGYLAWLLKRAVPSEPPAQIQAAAHARLVDVNRQHHREIRAERDERYRQADTGHARPNAAYREAMARHAAKLAAKRGTAAPAALAAAGVEDDGGWPEVAVPGTAGRR